MDNIIRISPRRYGQTKRIMDEIEKVWKPGMVIVGPNSRFDKYADTSTYDGHRLRLPSWYYNEDPYYVPIELLATDPERYWELVEYYVKKRSEIAEMWKPSLKIADKIVGKAIFTTLGSDTENNWVKGLWETGDMERTKNGLYRFFKPAEKAIEEFKEARRKQDPREFERQYLQIPPATDEP